MKCGSHYSLQNYFLSLFHCCSLQTFWLDGNFLTTLPEEMGNLQQLTCLGLSFNNFCELPAICEKLVTLDKLALAGNLLETLDLTVLNRMDHIKSVDLRWGVKLAGVYKKIATFYLQQRICATSGMFRNKLGSVFSLTSSLAFTEFCFWGCAESTWKSKLNWAVPDAEWTLPFLLWFAVALSFGSSRYQNLDLSFPFLLLCPRDVILILQAANCRPLRKGQRAFWVWQGSLVSVLRISFLCPCRVAARWPGFCFLDWIFLQNLLRIWESLKWLCVAV